MGPACILELEEHRTRCLELISYEQAGVITEDYAIMMISHLRGKSKIDPQRSSHIVKERCSLPSSIERHSLTTRNDQNKFQV